MLGGEFVKAPNPGDLTATSADANCGNIVKYWAGILEWCDPERDRCGLLVWVTRGRVIAPLEISHVKEIAGTPAPRDIVGCPVSDERYLHYIYMS